jgi:hypothetical protein
MCRQLAEELGCALPASDEFLANPSLAFGDYLIGLPSESVVLIDELDMLAGIGALEEFAMILRGVYSRRLISTGLTIPKTAIILASVRPPSRWIHNDFASPLNIGRHVQTAPFNRSQSESLARVLLPSLSGVDAAKLHEIVGGQPYLLQSALYWLHSFDGGIDGLEREMASPAGPFRHYASMLRGALSPAQRDQITLTGLAGANSELLIRLEEVGAIRWTSTGPEWLGTLHSAIFASDP